MNMKIPEHYSLVSEHPDHYVINDARDKTNFKIAKGQLSLGMHANLSKIKKMSDGGTAGSDDLGLMNDAPGGPTDSDHSNWGDNPSSGMLNNASPAIEAIKDPYLEGMHSGQIPNTGQPTGGGIDPSQLALPQNIQGQINGQAQPGGFNVPDPSKELESAFGLQKQAAGEAYNAQAGKAQADAKMYQDQQNEFQQLRQDHDRRLGVLNQRSDDLFAQASQGKIDPNNYWNSKSTASKVSTGLGIILAGFGAGLQHSSTNQAVEMLNNHINRDIDAQKANMGQANNIFKMNMEQSHNEQEAYMMTKSDMLTMTAARANQIAAQMGTPQAQANRDQLLAQIGTQQAMLHQQLAVAGIGRQAYTNGVPPQAVPYLHPDQQKRMVRLDNGSMADAGSEKNAETYNDSTASYSSLQSNLMKLKQMNTMGTYASPGGREAARALMGEITIGLNDFAKSHRISEQDIGFQKGQMSDPTSLWNKLSGAGNAGTDQLMEALSNKHRAVMTQYVPALGNQKTKQSNINFTKNR